jgi:hypothetical protein
MSDARLTPEQMEAILEEVATFQVDLEPDPTLPSLGTKYLQDVLARCRNYLNRISSYMQQLRKYERQVTMELRIAETDVEKKSADMLADNVIVRKGPSIEDRKAIIRTLLSGEFELITRLKLELSDATETYKIVKQVYDHLQRTSGDVKLQRSIVRDDKLSLLGGDPSVDVDGRRPDKSLPGGMPPMATSPVPSVDDIMDPSRRPDDLPEPVDGAHARMIQEWLSSNPKKEEGAPAPSDPSDSDAERKRVASISYSDLLK